MQLTKLYSRLMTLMFEEDEDIAMVLLALKTVVEKRLDVIEILVN